MAVNTGSVLFWGYSNEMVGSCPLAEDVGQMCSADTTSVFESVFFPKDDRRHNQSLVLQIFEWMKASSVSPTARSPTWSTQTLALVLRLLDSFRRTGILLFLTARDSIRAQQAVDMIEKKPDHVPHTLTTPSICVQSLLPRCTPHQPRATSSTTSLPLD
jgi:hypothetical protein